jgi:hypothetical protein
VFERFVKPLRSFLSGDRQEKPADEEYRPVTEGVGDAEASERIRSGCEVLLDVALVLETTVPLLAGTSDEEHERAANAVDFCQKVLDNAAKTVDELRTEPRAQDAVATADEVLRSFRSYREKYATNQQAPGSYPAALIDEDRKTFARAVLDLRLSAHGLVRALERPL